MNKLQVMKAALQQKRLQMGKPNKKVSGDEPADSLQGSPRANAQGENNAPGKTVSIQGGKNNPGRTPIQNDRAVQSPQPANQSVNAKPDGKKLQAKKAQGAVFFQKLKGRK
jgi:hypothetical protein